MNSGELHAGQLGDALDQLGHSRAEERRDLVEGGGGVLDAVVQQGGDDRVGVQTDLRDDLRNGERVDDVGGAVLALLAFVLGAGVLHRAVDLVEISEILTIEEVLATVRVDIVIEHGVDAGLVNTVRNNFHFDIGEFWTWLVFVISCDTYRIPVPLHTKLCSFQRIHRSILHHKPA